jgi:hypothetical protein
MSRTSYPSNAISVVIYGIRRAPEVESRVSQRLAEILSRTVGPQISVHVHKYCQRGEDVAHGGVTYAVGGRKRR